MFSLSPSPVAVPGRVPLLSVTASLFNGKGLTFTEGFRPGLGLDVQSLL